MKKGIFINLILCVFLISAALILSACGAEETEDVPDIESVDITITIDFPQKSKIIDLIQIPFKIEEETTVLQAIQLYGNINNISVLVDTTHSTLEGIHKVQNDIYTKDAEWRFKINGDYVSKDISEYVLKNGDSVEFIFTK